MPLKVGTLEDVPLVKVSFLSYDYKKTKKKKKRNNKTKPKRIGTKSKPKPKPRSCNSHGFRYSRSYENLQGGKKKKKIKIL